MKLISDALFLMLSDLAPNTNSSLQERARRDVGWVDSWLRPVYCDGQIPSKIKVGKDTVYDTTTRTLCVIRMQPIRIKILFSLKCHATVYYSSAAEQNSRRL